MGMTSWSAAGRSNVTAILTGALVLAGTALVTATAPSAQALSPGVVISQVYGGGGNAGATFTHDFVELFNRGADPVSIAGWSVQYASAAGTGNFAAGPALSGTLAPGQHYLVQLASNAAIGAALPTPDAASTGPNLSGSAGKVIVATTSTAVPCNGGSDPCTVGETAQIIDLVGYGSTANYSETAPASTLSATTAAIRGANGCTETDNNSADFTAGTPAPRNAASTATPCGDPPPDSAPGVASVAPADGTSNVAVGSSITVTFTEAVAVSDSWFTLSCATSGAHAGVTSGGPTTFTIDPDTDFANSETCTLTVLAAAVTDTDTSDPPDVMAADVSSDFSTVALDPCTGPITPIPTIQGSGATAAVTGTVTTRGVVVSDDEGPSPALRGFNLQDIDGDDDPATSDGIFVFNSANTNLVALGDVVTVTGRAGESFGQTQIDQLSSVVTCGTGSVEPTEVTLPATDTTTLERSEGMLVTMPQTLYVTEHFQLGRFGEVVVSSGDRLYQPTSVVMPGAPALALQAQNDLNRIVIDDNQTNQNPDPIRIARNQMPLSASNTLRGGDTITGVVGVMSFSFSVYRIMPFNALGGGPPNFVAANARPAIPPPVGGSIQVAGMNLLNYFNTFNPGCQAGVAGPPTDCRGADNAVEFDRQWPKTVAAIVGTGAEVIGVNEIENDGYGVDSALAHLVGRLNEATTPGTYAYLDVDARTGQINALGSDAIKVGIIYQPAKATPLGVTAALNTVEFVNGGDPAPRSRPALAQAFRDISTGGVFSVVVNHLKSKGSVCTAPDAGDGQGNCNQVRANAATELIEWLATDPTGTGDPDYLLVGDLNSYAMEDPIRLLEEAGYANLVEQYNGPNAYSYVFNGQWGYLDHALGSPSVVAQVTGVGEWHINADEPLVLDYNTNFKSENLRATLYAPDQYRVSDHDPVIVGLDPTAQPGRVTGQGIINSPRGSSAAMPDARGKAQFTLDSRNVAGVATGSLRFTFGAGSFIVRSTSHDDLVIVGNRATFRGSATVNEVPGYTYVATAEDGPLDKLRLVVRDGIGAVIYDSGLQRVQPGDIRILS